MKGLVRIALRYGLIASLIGAVLFSTLYFLGRHPFLIPVFLDFRIILLGVFIFFTLREIREVHMNGILYFWQGVASSFIVATVYAVMMFFAIMLITEIHPKFLSDYIILSIEQLQSLPADIVDRIGKDVYGKTLEQLPSTEAADLALLYFTQTLGICFFISIILSVILRRQPTT